MSEADNPCERVPGWLLAIGPILVMVLVAVGLYVTAPFGNLERMADASTLEIIYLLTIIGAIAGIVPVAIGMLWFPYIRALDARFVHAFVALGAGVLLFIAFEMGGELVTYGGELESASVAVTVGVVGVVGTFVLMYALSEWREGASASAEKSGLQIAYLVAFALGLHSVGEGLAIGVTLVQGQATLVLMLVIGFVIHNILEGLTIIAAIARDAATPAFWHFAAVGLIAGGPVIFGGWLGSLGTSPLLAMACYAVAVGAIVQAIVEMTDLVRFDSGSLLTTTNAATFVAGFLLMFILEDLIVEGWIVPA